MTLQHSAHVKSKWKLFALLLLQNSSFNPLTASCRSLIIKAAQLTLIFFLIESFHDSWTQTNNDYCRLVTFSFFPVES